MKKFFAFLLTLITVFTLTSCNYYNKTLKPFNTNNIGSKLEEVYVNSYKNYFDSIVENINDNTIYRPDAWYDINYENVVNAYIDNNKNNTTPKKYIKFTGKYYFSNTLENRKAKFNIIFNNQTDNGEINAKYTLIYIDGVYYLNATENTISPNKSTNKFKNSYYTEYDIAIDSVKLAIFTFNDFISVNFYKQLFNTSHIEYALYKNDLKYTCLIKDTDNNTYESNKQIIANFYKYSYAMSEFNYYSQLNSKTQDVFNGPTTTLVNTLKYSIKECKSASVKKPNNYLNYTLVS